MELGENARTRSAKLQQLIQRINQDEEIPKARRDDSFLLRFLRAKKFDVDKSFRMVCCNQTNNNTNRIIDIFAL